MNTYCVSLKEQASNIRSIITKVVLILLATILFHPISGWATTITLTPVKDTYVDQSSPTSQYGNSTLIDTKYASTSFSFMKNGLSQPLVQFDLSGIPQGAQITTAYLRL